MISQTEYLPRRVIQIVSGSRSGSSLLKAVLAGSPDLDALSGEEEPYFGMCGEGYGLTSLDDSLHRVRHPALFRRMVYADLTAEDRWGWRLPMQYAGPLLARLLDANPPGDPAADEAWLRREGVWGNYDGAEAPLPFAGRPAYEMRPYVRPLPPRGRLTGTLLLKAPYTVYRPGVLEGIFPGAEFNYVVLTRNPAATINGLIAGWRSPFFHKHLTPHGWWKFDLPPGWTDYATAPVPERCWYQWHSSYERIAPRGGTVVKFEGLLADAGRTVTDVCRALGIEPPPRRGLPLVMATEAPAPFRWRRRAAEILPLLGRSRELINRLNYGDESQWV